MACFAFGRQFALLKLPKPITMKNFLLLVLYCTLSIACTNGKGNKIVNYKELNTIEAQTIVSYNNTVVELTDYQTSYLSEIDGSLAKIQEGLENPANPTAFLAILPIFSNVNFSAEGNKPEDPPGDMSSQDQIFFKSMIKNMNSDFAKIKLVFNALNDYVKAEDYKDDSSKRGYHLIDSIYHLGDSYYNKHGEMLKRLKAIGDDAELVLLKTDPLKDYIYALKADRKAVGEFYDLLLSGVEDYDKIVKKVETKYVQLERMQQLHSKMDLQKIRDENGKEKMFTEFYRLFSEFLINTRKLMRNTAETGNLNKFELEDLASQEEAMRNAYNNFVD